MVAHIDADLVAETAAAVGRNGHQVTGFTDPIMALRAIEDAAEPPALVAGIRFGEGRLHGVALGLMAIRKHPGAPVLFIAAPEDVEHTLGVGQVIPAGCTATEIAAALELLLRARGFG